MTDRDTFAAAALTGLLAQRDGSFSEESYARAAYRWADVMLRARCDVSDRPKPISDARLAALEELSALDQELELKYGLTGNPMIKGQEHTPQMQTTLGDGSKPRGCTEPVAWAVVSDSTEKIDCEFVYPDPSTAGDVALDINGGVVPLYRSPTLTDEEREAVKWCRDNIIPMSSSASSFAFIHTDTLRKLLERLA